MSDLIDRQAAIDVMLMAIDDNWEFDYAVERMKELPSKQPEALTDKEQRIFLSAMGREEKICKQFDDEHRNCREPYEDSLVSVCRNIMRKVKGALWTT